MESSEGSTSSAQLLKNKYNLHDSTEVKTAALRTQQRTGERVAQNPLNRIQNYLYRFHEIIDQQDPHRSEHALDLIKGRFHSRYIIKPHEVPEAYFENQKRLAREQGHGDIEIIPEARSQLTEVIIADQTSSLDKWINYLSSPDAQYSDGLKYFTLRSVINMAEYDKERKMYPQRSKDTTKPFPDLNREALAYVLDAVDKKYKGQRVDLSSLDAKDATEFDDLLKGENFAKLYAFAIEKVTPASPEALTATSGEWVKYNQGSDHLPLVTSLQGHGTGWCTAGESTAATQLKGGDFYVYYSLDSNGKPFIPRAAIRMEGGKIAEVRGIAAEQNLDPLIIPVVEEKLKSFPDGPAYKKKVSDMRFLTAIDHKVKAEQPLDPAELTFLYEINSTIDGFGYEKDPRITELRSQRDTKKDMPVIFGCAKSQIARTMSQIRPDTKAYVGKLEPGIFDKLTNIEHVYISFPEGKIPRETIEIGGKSSQQLEAELKQRGIKISSYAEDMLKSSDFTTLKDPQNIDTIRLKVQDLGLPVNPTTEQIYARAKELGLELCPAELGPYKRLKDTNQPMGEWYYIAMKQIAGRGRVGVPSVFLLEHSGGGLWLDGSWAGPGRRWDPEYRFVFSLRKETQKLNPLDRFFKR
jgi:hypothetical protein